MSGKGRVLFESVQPSFKNACERKNILALFVIFLAKSLSFRVWLFGVSSTSILKNSPNNNNNSRKRLRWFFKKKIFHPLDAAKLFRSPISL